MHADAEAEVSIALSVENYLVWLLEHGRITVGHGPGDPEALTLLELRPLHLDVLGERATVAGGRGVEAQKFFGRGIQQGVALSA